jgi:hypothetical protein
MRLRFGAGKIRAAVAIATGSLINVVIAASPAASNGESLCPTWMCWRGSSRFSPLRKRCALYGRYHPTFSDVRAAIPDVQDGLSTKCAEGLATLMTLSYSTLPVTSPLNWISSIAGTLTTIS